jgi:hypothetical protein
MWGLRMIGGAVKEREGGNEMVDGKDFGEEVGGVNEAGKEDKMEELLAGPLLEPIESHVDRLELFRPNRRSRKTNRTLVVHEEERGRLLGVAKVG